MTMQSTIVRPDALDQAIQIVIQDIRIPKNLRTALAVYQNQRADRLANGCKPDNSRSCEGNGILNCFCTGLGQGMNIQMSIDSESLEWSVEINGVRHERVTRDDMEALIECAVIVTETSMLKLLSARPQ
jgi:hypothetical protein